MNPSAPLERGLAATTALLSVLHLPAALLGALLRLHPATVTVGRVLAASVGLAQLSSLPGGSAPALLLGGLSLVVLRAERLLLALALGFGLGVAAMSHDPVLGLVAAGVAAVAAIASRPPATPHSFRIATGASFLLAVALGLELAGTLPPRLALEAARLGLPAVAREVRVAKAWAAAERNDALAAAEALAPLHPPLGRRGDWLRAWVQVHLSKDGDLSAALDRLWQAGERTLPAWAQHEPWAVDWAVLLARRGARAEAIEALKGVEGESAAWWRATLDPTVPLPEPLPEGAAWRCLAAERLHSLPLSAECFSLDPDQLAAARVLAQLGDALARRRLAFVQIPEPRDADFDGAIEFRGIDLPTTCIPRGETRTFRWLWHVTGGFMPSEHIWAFVHFRGPDGALFGIDHPLGGKESSAWRPGHWVDDALRFTVPKDAKPGRYEADLGLHALGSGLRLPLRGQPGHIRFLHGGVIEVCP